MTAKRINITLDEETLDILDAMSNAYGMNRSESIRFMCEILFELDAWSVLESIAIESNDSLYYNPTKYDLKKAARSCTVSKETN